MNRYELNTVGNDYVVGDIHGMFSKLQTQLDEMGFNPEVDRLFSVGDLVDRGPDSEVSLDWLAKPWFHAIRGNHEQMAIDAAVGLYDAEIYAFNGGAWFLGLTQDHRILFADAFEQMPLWMEIETKNGLVGVVHGDAPNDWNLINKFNEDCLLWGRTRITRKHIVPVLNITKVYSGHTPVKEKKVYGNVHFIDTGAVFGGPFTIEKL